MRRESRRARPYWHVDAKWISALLLVPILGATLLVQSLVQITAEEPAIETMSRAMALMLSRNGLDDETEIVQMRGLVQSRPDRQVQPIPGLRLIIREQDLEGSPARQIRLNLFRRLAKPMYHDGGRGLAALADDAELRQRILENSTLLNIPTLQNHRFLQQARDILAAICVALLIPLVAFSHRFGRIGSPGLVILVSSLPGAVFTTSVSQTASQTSATSASTEPDAISMAGALAGQMLPAWSSMVAPSYTTMLLAGLGLVFLALASNLVWRLVRRSNRPVSSPLASDTA